MAEQKRPTDRFWKPCVSAGRPCTRRTWGSFTPSKATLCPSIVNCLLTCRNCSRHLSYKFHAETRLVISAGFRETRSGPAAATSPRRFPHSAARRASTAISPRSEEHTSELQSLMRISYAVFCLKKKNKQTHVQTTH